MGLRARILSVAGLACAVTAGALPVAAPAHTLGAVQARQTATAAAQRLARARGDDAPARYTRPACRRASQHRFICFTTLRGTARCDTRETACDGAAPFELRYRILVVYPSERARIPRTYLAQM
ncbi:MAG TPA: hypothetical protein VNB64_00695 [Solirubrobacteraceae bacterium]|nr:hypothetical protein [Solirubrobacteraceae bacterium]